MLIDIIFIILVFVALYKGYTRGLIIAVFSILALVIGLAAAIKLSVVTANRLKDAVHIEARWLPVLAFALVFIVVVLLVRLVARLLEKTAELTFLGWANKLGGILIYLVLYTVIFSVLLFYIEKSGLLSTAALAASRSYPFIQPWGIRTIDALGMLLPLFKDMFRQLEVFFAGLSGAIQTT